MVLRGEGPLAVGMRLVVVTAAVVEAGFRVLLQLLGQVGSWSTGWDVVFVPILWDLQLFYEAHGSGRIKKGRVSESWIYIVLNPLNVTVLLSYLHIIYFCNHQRDR